MQIFVKSIERFNSPVYFAAPCSLNNVSIFHNIMPLHSLIRKQLWAGNRICLGNEADNVPADGTCRLTYYITTHLSLLPETKVNIS